MKLVVAVVDEPVAGLWHLVPGAGEIAKRLGHDEAGLLGDLVEDRVVGIQLAQGVHLGAVDREVTPEGSASDGLCDHGRAVAQRAAARRRGSR